METKTKPYPFDVHALNKGDRIPPEECERLAGLRRDHKNYALRILELKQMLERQWYRERDEVVTTVAEKDGIRICNDDDAVGVNAQRARQKIHGLRRDLVHMNGVDRSKLTSKENRDVHEKETTRLAAFISGGVAKVRAVLRGHKRSTPGLTD